jgi:ubiquinone/menaquinone biosynthesis C-methylase UbiE
MLVAARRGGTKPVNRAAPSVSDTSARTSEAYFDEHSEFWESLYEGDDVFARIHRRRESTALEWLRRSAHTGGRQSILEVGCGAGHLTVELSAHNRVVAIDTSSRMLARARRRVPSQSTTFLRADAAHVPLPDSSVDVVVGLGVLPWVPDPSAVLAEVARVLRVGGQAVMNVDNRWRLATILDPLRTPVTAAPRRLVRRQLGPPDPSSPRATMTTAAEFAAALRMSGLEVVTDRWIGFGPVTVFGRTVLPRGLSTRLDTRLQSRADSGSPLRRLASQYLVLCVRSEGADAHARR